MAEYKKTEFEKECEREYRHYHYNPIIWICNVALGLAGAWIYTAYLAPHFNLPNALWTQIIAFIVCVGVVTEIAAHIDGYYDDTLISNDGPPNLLIGCAAGTFLGLCVLNYDDKFYFAPILCVIILSILRFMLFSGGRFWNCFSSFSSTFGTVICLVPVAMLFMFTLLILVEGLTGFPIPSSLRKLLILTAGAVMAGICIILAIRSLSKGATSDN